MTLPAITPEESAARRESVYACRADLALEGLETPVELQELGKRFIKGELTPNDYRQACFDYAKQFVKNPDWKPSTGSLPE